MKIDNAGNVVEVTPDFSMFDEGEGAFTLAAMHHNMLTGKHPLYGPDNVDSVSAKIRVSLKRGMRVAGFEVTDKSQPDGWINAAGETGFFRRDKNGVYRMVNDNRGGYIIHDGGTIFGAGKTLDVAKAKAGTVLSDDELAELPEWVENIGMAPDGFYTNKATDALLAQVADQGGAIAWGFLKDGKTACSVYGALYGETQTR